MAGVYSLLKVLMFIKIFFLLLSGREIVSADLRTSLYLKIWGSSFVTA